MRAPNTRDLIEAWADRYCTEHTDLDHTNGCPAEKVAQEWLAETIRQAKEQAWDTGWIARANNDPATTNPYRSQP